MNHRERGSSLLSDKQLTLSIPYGFSFSTGIFGQSQPLILTVNFDACNFSDCSFDALV